MLLRYWLMSGRCANLSVAVLLVVLLLSGGCMGGGSDLGDSSGSTSPKTNSVTDTGDTKDDTKPTPGTTRESGADGATSGEVQIMEVISGSSGLEQRQVVISPSASALAEATGVQVPEAGDGTYLAVFWGEKATGGYTVEVLDARIRNGRLVVRTDLKPPPTDAMVSQALTYPYAAAVIRGEFSEDENLVFVNQRGRELNWSVRRF